MTINVFESEIKTINEIFKSKNIVDLEDGCGAIKIDISLYLNQLEEK